MNGIIDQLMQNPEFRNAVKVSTGSNKQFIQNQPASGIVAPNLSQQQGFQQQALGQMGQLASQAGMPAKSFSVSSPISLANALRNQGSIGGWIPDAMQTTNAFMPWTQMSVANQYGTDPYSEQSRMLAMQERGF